MELYIHVSGVARALFRDGGGPTAKGEEDWCQAAQGTVRPVLIVDVAQLVIAEAAWQTASTISRANSSSRARLLKASTQGPTGGRGRRSTARQYFVTQATGSRR